MRHYRIFAAAALLAGLSGGLAYYGISRGSQTQPTPHQQSSPAPFRSDLPEKVNFSEHIAPVIYRSCAGCHRPGEAGPFPLLTYEDVFQRAELVRYVTETRYMPPWPADASYRHFARENFLTAEQIALIGRWVEQGAPEGDPKKLPDLPKFPTGSQLGKPDLVVKMPRAYRIKGDNSDKFVSMKLPFSMPRDTFVRTIEFVPGNRKLVHHVNAHLISYSQGRPRHLLRGPWFVEAGEHNMHPLEGLGLGDTTALGASLTLSVANYLPGTSPPLYPPGIGGFRVSREADLLMHHIHYGPASEDAAD